MTKDTPSIWPQAVVFHSARCAKMWPPSQHENPANEPTGRPAEDREAGHSSFQLLLMPLSLNSTFAQLMWQQRAESRTYCGILNITSCSFSKNDLTLLPQYSYDTLKTRPSPLLHFSIFFKIMFLLLMLEFQVNTSFKQNSGGKATWFHEISLQSTITSNVHYFTS